MKLIRQVPGKEKLMMTEDHSLIVVRDGKMIECKPLEVLDTDFIVVEDEA